MPRSSRTPAAIAGPSYLAALDLKKATFTAVGYGLDGFLTGSLLSNHPFTLDDGIRSYRDVSVITEHDAFPDRFLKITASVCFGDSGGPLFHNGTVVALNTWTFSTRCTGPNLEYRTDSAAAQEFPRSESLAAYQRAGPSGPLFRVRPPCHQIREVAIAPVELPGFLDVSDLGRDAVRRPLVLGLKLTTVRARQRLRHGASVFAYTSVDKYKVWLWRQRSHPCIASRT